MDGCIIKAMANPRLVGLTDIMGERHGYYGESECFIFSFKRIWCSYLIRMGCVTSKEKRMIDERDKFLIGYVKETLPKFLDSEYCQIVEGSFMCLTTFTTAFLLYTKNQEDSNVPPELLHIRQLQTFVHSYFTCLENKNIKIFVDGIIDHKVIVGITLTKWPR